MTEAEREKLVSEGETFEGMVEHSESSPTDRRMSQVRLSVRFKDGQAVEFGEERVLVRYDAADRTRIVIDVPALHKRALHDYIQREQQQKTQPAARPDRPALGRADALPELRCAGRPGEGVPGSRPAVPVLPAADTRDPAALRPGPPSPGRSSRC
jgi:hypothetical protein